MKVAFFMGCATDFVYPELVLRLIDFLAKHDVEVVVPEEPELLRRCHLLLR